MELDERVDYNLFRGQDQPTAGVAFKESVRKMKNKTEILQLLKDAQPDLFRQFGVNRLAIFGSYARGDQSESSDVDILVEVDPSIGLRFVDLADTIESLLGLPVDLVSRRAITLRNWRVIEKELINVQ